MSGAASEPGLTFERNKIMPPIGAWEGVGSDIKWNFPMSIVHS